MSRCLWLAISAALATAGCSSLTATPSCDPSQAALAGAANYLVARDNAGDLNGVLAGYTADVKWYPPSGPPLSGIEAIRPRYEQLFATHSVTLTSEVLETGGTDNSGFVIGNTQGTLTPLSGGQATVVNDRFVAIVRCENGDWKVSRLVWSPR